MSSVRCVLESEEQASSHEILLSALKLKTETQDHCKDGIWISRQYLKAKYFIFSHPIVHRKAAKYAFHACKLLDSSFGSLATRIMGRGKASKLINYDK